MRSFSYPSSAQLLETYARLYVHQNVLLLIFSCQDVLHLLLAAAINMHTFMGTHVALFDVGSKMNHSCAPNLSYCSR